MEEQIRTFCNDVIFSLPSEPWKISGDVSIAQTCYHIENSLVIHSDESLDTLDLNMSPIDHFGTFDIDAAHLE